MRFGGTCLVAFLFGLRAAVASAEGGTARPDFSVLTPAMQGRFFVSSAVDVTAFFPPGVAIGQLATSGRTKQLRALVEREAYDPIRTIADRLIDALAVASYRAAYEPVPRGPAGSLHSLSWGDLPERPQGELIFDLTVHWICLCADVTFSDHYPAISVSWRLARVRQTISATALAEEFAKYQFVRQRAALRFSGRQFGVYPFPRRHFEQSLR